VREELSRDRDAAPCRQPGALVAPVLTQMKRSTRASPPLVRPAAPVLMDDDAYLRELARRFA
jgi:hypothetical protein